MDLFFSFKFKLICFKLENILPWSECDQLYITKFIINNINIILTSYLNNFVQHKWIWMFKQELWAMFRNILVWIKHYKWTNRNKTYTDRCLWKHSCSTRNIRIIRSTYYIQAILCNITQYKRMYFESNSLLHARICGRSQFHIQICSLADVSE